MSEPNPKFEGRSWGAHMVSGALWMIALRWAVRLTGLVSTIILARVLAPHDFGIVAMAMIVVGTLEIFNYTGQKLVLIRLENPTAEHFDSAWTVSFLIGLGIAAAILVVSPFSELYFHEPRVVPVMQCLALRALMGGLENIGTVNFRRDLKFNRFFSYNVYPKMVSFVITVTLAFVLRNYWALVVGMLSGQAALIVLSYVMHKHRPRFTLSKVREIWSFSIWSFIRSVGVYINTQVDQIMVGGFGGSSLMGRYAVATDVAQSPSREINEPMVAVLYPVMSRLQDNPTELRHAYLRTLGWTAFIFSTIGIGVALIAADFQHLVLGAKWDGIAPLMVWLAVCVSINGLGTPAYSLFDALGKPRTGARLVWVRTFILAAAIVPVAYLTKNLIAIAACRAAAEVVFLPGLFLAVHREVNISFRQYAETLYRPIVASAAMAVVVVLLNGALPFTGPLRLVIDVVAGAAAFAGVAVTLWWTAGRPNTPEADVLHYVTRFAGWIPSFVSK
jgi:lipopolysaccharide exporter